MRLSIGIDSVSTNDVGASVDAFGDRYLRRVYTDAELTPTAGMSPERLRQYLAGRFAAKEAVFKALRCPSSVALPWRSIEIVADEQGRPGARLAGEVAAWASERGIGDVDVSITHDRGTALGIASVRP